MYADAETLLCSYLAGIPGVRGVSVETPADLLDRLPFVQVARIGGGDDYLTDHAMVDVDVLDASRVTSLRMARVVHQRMMLLRHSTVDGVLVDTVDTVTGPRWVDYDDEHVVRYVATYTLDSRIVAATS